MVETRSIIVNGTEVFVRSNGEILTNKGKIKKPYIDNVGYASVTVWNKGKGKRCLVHRLVAKAFIDDYADDKQVHHLNEDKTDNRLENLIAMDMEKHMHLHKQIYPIAKQCEVCGKEFVPHKTKRKRAKTCSYECWRKTCIANAETRKKPINQYSVDGKFLRRWDSARDIQNETGFFESNINKCCKGKIRMYKGFVWKYA